MRQNLHQMKAALAAIAFTVTGFASSTLKADAQSPAANRAAVEEKFAAWQTGKGSPFELLAESASWTIEGNSAASKTYPTKEAFLREVIRPFNARLSIGLKPRVRSITAEDNRVVILFDAQGIARDGEPYVNSYAWFFEMQGGQVVNATAFYDALAFNDLWSRVAPAE